MLLKDLRPGTEFIFVSELNSEMESPEKEKMITKNHLVEMHLPENPNPGASQPISPVLGLLNSGSSSVTSVEHEMLKMEVIPLYHSDI